MVPGGGIEPPTRGFSIHCSTPELPGQGNEIRSGARGLSEALSTVQRVQAKNLAAMCPASFQHTALTATPSNDSLLSIARALPALGGARGDEVKHSVSGARSCATLKAVASKQTAWQRCQPHGDKRVPGPTPGWIVSAPAHR